MQKIPAIVLTEEFSTNELIKLYLQEFENIELLPEISTSDEIYNKVVKENGQLLLIIDLSSEANKKINLISEICKEYRECKILALSDNPSVNLIIEIMRAGAKEFIPVPIIKNEFFESVKKLIYKKDETNHKNKCKIITIFSNKGGIGKTSIASNLALELAKNTKENVALIDLNFQAGDITTFLDLKPSFNISYMLENLDKINEMFLLSTMERYKRTSLYVLADPPYFKQADNITPKHITKLFNLLRNTFSYIIVDAESNFDGKTISALDNSDMIMLITVANLPALRNTQRCLELFDKLGYDREKIKIILNRYMENDEIKESDVQKVLSKDIYWKIPNNYFALMTAINKGIPVSDINQMTNVAQSYKELANYVSDNIYKLNVVEQFEHILNKG